MNIYSHIRHLILALCAISSTVAFAQVAEPEAFSAKVVDVRSGSSYRIDAGGDLRTIFLFGATAARTTTREGSRAKAQAEVYTLGHTVNIIIRDASGPVPYAEILLAGGRNLAHELVRNGWARWDRVRAKNDTALEALETLAREEGAGMWAGAATTARITAEAPQAFSPVQSEETIQIGTPLSPPTSTKRRATRDPFGTVHLQSKGRISTTRIIERKNDLRERQAAELEAQRIAAEERRLAYEAEMEARQAAFAESQRVAMEQEQQRLQLEREQLQNQALYNQLYQDQQNYSGYINGQYFYNSPPPLLPGQPQIIIRHTPHPDEDVPPATSE